MNTLHNNRDVVLLYAVLLFAISFVVVYAVTPFIIRLAKHYNCIDFPDARRFHKKTTPRWGGAAFFIGVLSSCLFMEKDATLFYYLLVSFLLMGLGMIDDRFQLGWKVKTLGMLLGTTIIVFGGDVVIHNIGDYGSFGRMDLGVLSIPFTYFGVIGVTNAINLIDGLNGLASGISLLAFLFMGIASIIIGNDQLALLCFAFVGALSGFLRYNFPRAKIFMGDSGSLFLGFSLAFTAILLTQNADHTLSPSPVFPVLVLLVPIFDTLRVMFLRIFSFRNPFKADKTHLHHLLVRRNISSTKAVVSIWLLTALLGGISLLLLRRSSMPYMIIALCFSLLLALLAEALATRRR